MRSIYEKEYRAIMRRLTTARLNAGLRQEDVSKRFGWHRTTVSKMESCRRRVDALELKWMARLYHVPVDSITGR